MRQQPTCRGQFGPSQRLAVRRVKSAESAVAKSDRRVDGALQPVVFVTVTASGEAAETRTNSAVILDNLKAQGLLPQREPSQLD